MKFTTIFNEEFDVPCQGCLNRDDSKFAKGFIYRSDLFKVSQDMELAVPGMMVIAPLRHVCAFTDLTAEEQKEWCELIVKCKKALIDLWDIHKTAFIFYESGNNHIHFIIIPLWEWLERKSNYSVLAELMAREDEFKKDEENMAKTIEYIGKLQQWFAEN